MIPIAEIQFESGYRIPRESGDDPKPVLAFGIDSAYSPRERG